MKIFIKMILLMLLFIGVNLWASDVVATVNDKEITKEDVENFIVTNMHMPNARFDILNDVDKRVFVNQMIDRKLFAEEAKRVHIENDSEFKAALEKMRDKLLIDYWMKKQAEEIVISDKEARAYYDSNITNFNRPASVKVRHILVNNNDKAVEIISLLEGKRDEVLKEKFIKLAKRHSIGPSRSNGGELDWFIQEQMLPEFSDVAFRLKKGKITKKPVHTQFGYHVIYLEDKKEKALLPFAQVKKEIVKTLRVLQFKTKLEQLSKKMKETAKITVK